jgi:hypothetical protein
VQACKCFVQKAVMKDGNGNRLPRSGVA